MHHFQKNIFFKAFLMSAFVGGLVFLTPTDILAKKLEIIIGGENYCKTDEECSGTSYCHNTSHICISCPKPFEWTGTDCICPTGTVPNADNTSCVECITDENCTSLKGGNDWYCDTSANTCLNCAAPKEWHADTNTCDCPSNSSDEGGVCVCDHPNKALKDGVCQCRVTDGATACPNSDFMGEINCYCCPDDKPVWNKSSGELARCLSCSEIDNTKPHYDSNKKQCVECLTDAHCAKEKECSVKNTCTCAMTQDDCPSSDFMGTDICACCPSDSPIWDNIRGSCTTCSEMDTTKTYYNSDTNTCEECLIDEHCQNDRICSTDKTCICEMKASDCPNSDYVDEHCMCCPVDKPLWYAKGNKCVENTCYGKMLVAGFSEENFTVTKSSIVYNGNMDIKTNLDISQCDLMVNGELRISNGTTSVKNIEVLNAKGDNAIYLLSGTKLEVSGNVTSSVTGSTGTIYGIHIGNASMMVNGNIKSEVINSTGLAYGIYVGGGSVIVQGSITGVFLSGTGELYGVYAGRGTIDAGGNIMCSITGNTGTRYGVFVDGGKIMTQGDIISNIKSDTGKLYGVYTANGIMKAKGNITGTISSGTGKLYGVYAENGSMQAEGDISGTISSDTGELYGIYINNGTIVAQSDIVGVISSITGSARYGVYRDDAGNGSLTASNIYYCGALSQIGINGTLIKKCQ